MSATAARSGSSTVQAIASGSELQALARRRRAAILGRLDVPLPLNAPRLDVSLTRRQDS
jgi:hypothetical protein